MPCVSGILLTVTALGVGAAIELAGDYVWGEYNLLVLPPSFPYGGSPAHMTAIIANTSGRDPHAIVLCVLNKMVSHRDCRLPSIANCCT